MGRTPVIDRANAGNFFDTNVIAHIASRKPVKADRAEAPIRGGGAISVQVLNGIANVARRKMRMSWHDTHASLSLLRGLLTVHGAAVETHETRSALVERHNLSSRKRPSLAAARWKIRAA
jgi:predicted nucleic acid-binding protein